MFLRGLHDFKIQLPLYLLQPDLLIRSFPNNLKTISYPLSLWGFNGRPCLFGSAVVRNTNELELTNHQKSREKYG